MIKIIFEYIEIWFHKKQYGTPLQETYMGKFFVKYPDGNRSIKMFYKNAKTYSELFKGEIWHIPSNKVIQ